VQKKQKKLTDFVKTKSQKSTPSSSTESRRVEASEQRESREDVFIDIDELLARIHQRKQSNSTTSMQQQTPQQQSTTPTTTVEREVVKKEEVKVKQEDTAVIQDRISEIAQRALERDITIIECDKMGVCQDNRRLGEVFEDEYGVKWQRTFINTTRLPIFLDFIAEEAEIKGRVGKAYVVVTTSGAQAIIPDEFICEAVTRYGVLLKIDKCINYKPSPWAEKSRRKQK